MIDMIKKNMFKPSYHILKNFKFQSGEVIKELEMEYTTLGNAIRDEEGRIKNGLLFLHGWSGDYTSFRRFMDLTEPGQAFDKDRFYLISTTALGSPGSSAPSTSISGNDFPKYTIEDMVNAQYRLLKEHMNVDHLLGVIGTSMGGFQALQWGISYSDFMDFIIPIVTSSAVLGRNLAIFALMNSIIEEHPLYKEGKYLDNPAVKNAFELQFLFVFGASYYNKAFPKRDILLQSLEEQGAEGLKMDARDVIWRNNAAISFDSRDKLSKIRAKAIIIGIEGDEFFPPEIDTIPLSESISNSELFIFKSDLGHLGINETEKMTDVISNFMSRI